MRLSKRKRDQSTYVYQEGVLVIYNGMPLNLEGSDPDAMVVEGAGSSSANGVYLRDGDNGGKPQYTQNGGSSPSDSIRWVVSNWLIKNDYDGAGEDVATPDLVSTWEVFFGTPPVPTVRRATWADIDNAGIGRGSVPTL